MTIVEADGTTARRASRVRIILPVGVRRPGSHKAGVELRDLSTHGFRAEVFERLSPNDKLWLKLPGVEGWEARVAWVRGDEIGCEFLQPLHPAVVNIILAQAAS
jgi:hypothetical protein